MVHSIPRSQGQNGTPEMCFMQNNGILDILRMQCSVKPPSLQTTPASCEWLQSTVFLLLGHIASVDSSPVHPTSVRATGVPAGVSITTSVLNARAPEDKMS